jgi:hypothetical protein
MAALLGVKIGRMLVETGQNGSKPTFLSRPATVSKERRLSSMFRRNVQGVTETKPLRVILVAEADHHRVGAALLHLERTIVKAKLFYNDPETLREFPVVGQGNAYAVLHYPSALRSVQ